MADGAPVAPELVDYVDDYLEETDLHEAVGSEELDADSNLIVFCRELFAQLFANVIKEPITTIGPASAEKANLLLRRRRQGWPDPLRRLVRRFQHLCKIYPDLIGKQYGGGSDEISEFHLEFVPGLLAEVEAWADQAKQEELRSAVRRVRALYKEAVKRFYDDVARTYGEP